MGEMMKKSLMIGICIVFLAMVGTVVAKNVGAPPKFVPFQPPESQLTKIVLIRYAPGFQKEKPCDYDGICDPDERGWCDDCKGGKETESACYEFLAGSKPRWNWVEDYYYGDGLGDVSAWATATWDAATSATIFGSGYLGEYPWGTYDYINSISYGNYDDPNVIAVTAIWYRGKNIYEYDIMFDTDYFPGDGSVDLDTVALHEFGHAAGLGDLYDTVCEDEVMYGYYVGIKHDLREGDIAGIQKLYGV